MPSERTHMRLDRARELGAVERRHEGRALEGLSLTSEEVGRALDRAAKLEWQTMPFAFREQAITELLAGGAGKLDRKHGHGSDFGP